MRPSLRSAGSRRSVGFVAFGVLLFARLTLVLGGPAGEAPASAPGAEGAAPRVEGADLLQGAAPHAPPAAPPGLAPVSGTDLGVSPALARHRLRLCLSVSALVAGAGLTIIIARRNAIAILMGIELLLNSAGLNFVAFAKYVARDILDGQVVTIFIIVIAAAEAAVALAIVLNIYNHLNTVQVDEADELKG